MKQLKLIILLSMLLTWGLSAAQTEGTAPLSPGVADSIVVQREKEIRSEYGFRDTDRVSEVLQNLEIKNPDRWKTYLGLEADNRAIDAMTLGQLGITPYKALLAKQYSIYGFTELSTLLEVSGSLSMPIKKLKMMLGIANPNLPKYDNSSLQTLDITPERVQEVADEFNAHTIGYGLNITGVGMAIVFTALLITSLIVGQLKHLNREKKSPAADLKLSPGGKVLAASATLNQDIIVALIAALHIHQQSIDDKRKLALTYRRTPANQWRASSFLRMPNREITLTRK